MEGWGVVAVDWCAEVLAEDGEGVDSEVLVVLGDSGGGGGGEGKDLCFGGVDGETDVCPFGDDCLEDFVKVLGVDE